MSMLQSAIRLPHGLLGVAAGHFDGLSHEHIYGAVPAMSQNESGTVWDVNDTDYPWSSFASASQLTIPAVNASDDGKDIEIHGLDGNYHVITEVIEVSSSAPVTTTQSFIRVSKAFITNGSATNVGNIDIEISSTEVARIIAGNGQTLMAIYTVPAGYTAYILKGVATCQAGADATGDMFVRYFGQTSFRIGHAFEVSGSGGEYNYDFPIPLPIPEKSDIDVRADVRSNNARLTASFDVLLERN